MAKGGPLENAPETARPDFDMMRGLDKLRKETFEGVVEVAKKVTEIEHMILSLAARMGLGWGTGWFDSKPGDGTQCPGCGKVHGPPGPKLTPGYL